MKVGIELSMHLQSKAHNTIKIAIYIQIVSIKTVTNENFLVTGMSAKLYERPYRFVVGVIKCWKLTVGMIKVRVSWFRVDLRSPTLVSLYAA